MGGLESKTNFKRVRAVGSLAAFLFSLPAFCLGVGEIRVLKGHVPAAVARLKPVAHLAETNRLHLAIGLPVRDPAGLNDFIKRVSDSADPSYRHYVTSDEFTAKWGPSFADYRNVAAFAGTNHLSIKHTHRNRMLLDVVGSAGDVEKAFHVKLNLYQHPTENRLFYAPETEPSVDASLPILDIEGLNNYSMPRRIGRKATLPGANAGPMPLAYTGSGPSNSYLAVDIRAAYVSGVTLTGAGQTLAIVSFDGYYPSDIAAYESSNNLAPVPLTNVLIDFASGKPGSSGISGAVGEDSLDIEMAIAMAPGLSSLMVYEAPSAEYPLLVPHANDLLNQIATDNLAKQISTSWLWYGGTLGWQYGDDSTTTQIFQQMAAQGQSFFCGSGDGGAYLGDTPSGDGYWAQYNNDAPLLTSPYITSVGGTTLTTSGPGGVWEGEVVWNQKTTGQGTLSSSGTISDSYAIPVWQQSVNMSANGGSITMRNTPDVAILADGVFVVAYNGEWNILSGTSVASPLWAGFTALVNQQAALDGQPPVGFINPAIYAIGESTNYQVCFNDITSGNNTNSYCPTNFFAVPGYDLCSGWGTPAGQALINALASPDPLAITPTTGFTAANGPFGGPFNITSEGYVLTNTGTAALTWNSGNTNSWLDVSPSSGSIPANSSETITVSLDPSASGLPSSNYIGTLCFTNLATGYTQSRQFTLEVGQPLVYNGSFQTGDITGWEESGWWYDERFDYVFRDLYNGLNVLVIQNSTLGSFSEYAWWGPDIEIPGYLSQTIPTVVGQAYLVSYIIQPLRGNWDVFWNGQPVSQTTWPVFTPGYTTLSFFATATTPMTTLSFGWCDIVTGGSAALFDITGVSVTPVSNVAPIISLQPTSTNVAAGSEVRFSVVVAGSPTLNYQWQLNGTNLEDNGRIIGSTSNVLAFASTVTGDIGSYSVIVTNFFGSITSSVATLTLVGSNLLLNGSFESPVIASNSTSIVTPTGWSSTTCVINGNPFPGYGPTAYGIFPPNYPGLPTTLYGSIGQGPFPEDGNQYIAPYGGSPSQMFIITNAGLYQVSWYDNNLISYGGLSTNCPYACLLLNSSNSIVASNNFDGFNLSTFQQLVWRNKFYNAFLLDGTYTLEFVGLGSGYNTLEVIDNVSVRPVLQPVATPSPPSITMPQILGGNQLGITVSGSANAVYDVLTSTNLTNWTYLLTVTNVTGSNTFVLPATNSPAEYYILRSH